MPTEIKPFNPQDWLDALRSGDYKRGVGGLRQVSTDGTNYFCCLGVLCDLAEKAGVVVAARNVFSFSYDGCQTLPPASVIAWANLTSSNPRFNSEDSLVSFNDIAEYSFSEIADTIESNMSVVFVDA